MREQQMTNLNAADADTIVIANFEYYSCSVRKMQVLGSLSYPCQQWALLGEFEASDTRSEQIFNLTQPMWARYLKLRFLTHHGSQHYWSLSVVRAYGQTHVDKFNSDNARLRDAVNAVASANQQQLEAQPEVSPSAGSLDEAAPPAAPPPPPTPPRRP